MVTENYDSYLDPANWPNDAEPLRLAATYGWNDASSVAPLWHPGVPDPQTDENPDDLSDRRGFQNLEHETGLEPATPTLAKRRKAQK
jgi:hypothetical protein